MRMEIKSPGSYSNVALVLVYSPRDRLVITDAYEHSWDGQNMDLDKLEHVCDGLHMQYFELQQCLLLYMNSDCQDILIETDGDMLYFFAEITNRGTLSGQNTESEETYLPAGAISLKKQGNILLFSKVDPPTGKKQPSNVLLRSSDLDEIDALKEEIRRLEKVLSQVCDNAYSDIYQKVQNIEINQKTQELYQIKKRYEEAKLSSEELQKERDSLIQKKEELDARKEVLLKEIMSIEGITAGSEQNIKQLENKLQGLLEDMGLDLSTLQHYKDDGEVDVLVQRTAELEKEIKETLRSRIEIRQQVCQQNHDRIAGVKHGSK